MTWMNESDIEQALRSHPVGERPNLAAGARTLHNLMRWVNQNSDGWPYWNPPGKAATKLMDLLQAHDPRRVYDDLEDCTLAELKATYTPLKGFRTKANRGDGTWGKRVPNTCDFVIVDPAEAARQRVEDAKDAIGTHVRYTVIIERPLSEDRASTVGVSAALHLQSELREVYDRLGETAPSMVVVGRRFEGRARLPLHELGADNDLNRHNFQDDPT